MIDYVAQMWGLAASGSPRGVFFFIALYAAVALGYSLIYQLRVRSWPEVDGILVHAGVEEWGSRKRSLSSQDYRAGAHYEYIVDGARFTGTRVSPWLLITSHNLRFLLERQFAEIADSPSGNVKVFFNPKRPVKSYLVKPGRAGICLTAVLGVAPLFIYGLAYHV